MATKPLRSDSGLAFATGTASWQGPTGVGGLYYATGVGLVMRKTDNTEVTLGAGGGGSTGNWTFSANAADLGAAQIMTLGATTATAVSLSRVSGNVYLPGGTLRTVTPGNNTAGVNFTIGQNSGGNAGSGAAAGAGGANTYTSGQGGTANATASETAAGGGATTASGGQGGTGAASVNGPGAGGFLFLLGGAAGTVTSGFSNAVGGNVIIRGGAGSGGGASGSVFVGTSSTASVSIGAATVPTTIGSSAVTLAANAVLTGTASATNTTGISLAPNVADGASSVAFDVNCGTTLATAGASVARFRNNGTTLFTLDNTSFGYPIILSGTTKLAIGTTSITAMKCDDSTGIDLLTGGTPRMNVSGAGVVPSADATYALGSLSARWNGVFNTGPIGAKRNVQSGTTYTVVASDFLIALTNVAARTVQLPLASTFANGQWLMIRDDACTAGSANITVNRSGSDTFVIGTTGATSLLLNSNGGVFWLVSDGVNKWIKIN